MSQEARVLLRATVEGSRGAEPSRQGAERWTLVDYLFPAHAKQAWTGSVHNEVGLLRRKVA